MLAAIHGIALVLTLVIGIPLAGYVLAQIFRDAVGARTRSRRRRF